MHNENVAIPQPRTNPDAATRSGPSLGIDVEQRSDGPVLAHVTGEVDMVSTPRVRACINRHLSNRNGFVLDLGQVDFLAVSGLSVLVETKWRAERDQLDWAVVAAGRPVTRALDVCGLTDVLPAYASVGDAVAAVSSAVHAHAAR